MVKALSTNKVGRGGVVMGPIACNGVIQLFTAWTSRLVVLFLYSIPSFPIPSNRILD